MEIAEETDLNTGQAKLAVEKALEIMARRLAARDEISLAGFGKFSAAPGATG